ncbi:Tetratricopeptide repeat-containing protein [Lishizhenia tianjinensis]|uniref:Tetratricopeptide repeat-containing protein n=1 Tax=Lishizhenia tianjinensis TaxID=477690 RepID=A0A1I6YPC2_9FLAO|nr:tetratricopeptide repeat protein [Lishizhenia tianjinensis]SFT52148.1 Tetratricopeptide repeat-containing protein [Lishizhenia tianjinensis]
MYEEEEEYFSEREFNEDLNAFNAMYRKDDFRFMDSDRLEALIDHFIISSNYKKAKWGVEMALSHFPFNTMFLLRKAQILSANGELKEALEILNELEKMDPTNLELVLTKASSFSQLRDSKNAIRYFNLALELADDMEKDEIYLDLAMEYNNVKDYKSAVKILKRAIAENPKNEVAVYEIAFCYDQLGEYKKAIKCFKDYIDENPYSFTAWYNLANAYLKVDNFEKAIWAYDYSIIINDDFPPAYFNLGNAYLSSSKPRKALECFEKCLEVEGEDALILSYMGECYEDLGELNLAMNCYNRSAILNPQLPEAWLGMGIVNDLEGKAEEAIKLVTKAIDLAPDNASFYHVLAGILEKEERMEDALEVYEKGVKLDDTNEDLALDYLKFLAGEAPYLVESIYESNPGFHNMPELDLIRVYAYYQNQEYTNAYLILDNIINTDADLAKKLFLHYPEAKNISGFRDRIEN